MVTLSVMHLLYDKKLEVKIKQLSNEILLLEKERLQVINYLEPYRLVIKQQTLLDLDELLQEKVLTDNFKAFKLDSIVSLYIQKLISINSNIETNNQLIKENKKAKISSSLYSLIISKFNKKLLQEVIDKNYVINFGRLGRFMIIRRLNKSSKKRVNWGASKKKKKAIIEAGGIPYYKHEAEQAKKEGKEYKGVDWIVTFPDLDFIFHWAKNTAYAEYFKIVKDYKIKPVRGKSSGVDKLTEVKKDLKEANLRYTISYESLQRV